VEETFLSPEFISGAVGFALMLLFAYFPKLNVWYAGLTSEIKSAIMIGLLVITTIIVTVLTVIGELPADQPVTWILVFKVFVAALATNQPAYNLLPEAKAVKEAKEARIS